MFVGLGGMGLLAQFLDGSFRTAEWLPRTRPVRECVRGLAWALVVTHLLIGPLGLVLGSVTDGPSGSRRRRRWPPSRPIPRSRTGSRRRQRPRLPVVRRAHPDPEAPRGATLRPRSRAWPDPRPACRRAPRRSNARHPDGRRTVRRPLSGCSGRPASSTNRRPRRAQGTDGHGARGHLRRRRARGPIRVLGATGALLAAVGSMGRRRLRAVHAAAGWSIVGLPSARSVIDRYR